MKKTITLLLITIGSYSYGQITPYVDVSAVWALPMEGKVGLDAGINFNRVSIEANILFIGPYRIGGTIGYQLGERGGEWLGMRPYAGIMYGKYYNSNKEDAVLQNQVAYTAGAKLIMGSWASNFHVIMSKKPEYYVTVGFQIVGIVKWACR